jgi:hypothetical protein
LKRKNTNSKENKEMEAERSAKIYHTPELTKLDVSRTLGAEGSSTDSDNETKSYLE